jgi:hypothetical protein
LRKKPPKRSEKGGFLEKMPEIRTGKGGDGEVEKVELGMRKAELEGDGGVGNLEIGEERFA